MKLPASLIACRRAVLDTMFWIYLFEDSPRYGELCERMLAEIGRGRVTGILTPVTAAELLVKPLERNRPDIADAYRNGIAGLRHVEKASLTFETGGLAGALRAKYRMPLPDMFQAAFALQTPRPCIVTNDRAMQRVKEIEVILLEDLLCGP